MRSPPGQASSLASAGGAILSFRIARREVGHLHGDQAAHFGFPKQLWSELYEQGRIDHHPVFPGRQGMAARRIERRGRHRGGDRADAPQLRARGRAPRRARGGGRVTRVHRHTTGPQGALVNAYLVETDEGVVAVDGTLTVSEGRAMRAPARLAREAPARRARHARPSGPLRRHRGARRRGRRPGYRDRRRRCRHPAGRCAQGGDPAPRCSATSGRESAGSPTERSPTASGSSSATRRSPSSTSGPASRPTTASGSSATTGAPSSSATRCTTASTPTSRTASMTSGSATSSG